MSNTDKVTARRNRQSQSTTAKQAGVKPRPKKPTQAQVKPRTLAILSAVARHAEANGRNGAKQNYTDKGTEILARAMAYADFLPTLSGAGITTDRSKTEAQRRREFCQSVGAMLVNVSDILHPNKNGEITHTRPENTIRSRVVEMAGTEKKPRRYFVVRSAKNDGTAEAQAYVIRID